VELESIISLNVWAGVLASLIFTPEFIWGTVGAETIRGVRDVVETSLSGLDDFGGQGGPKYSSSCAEGLFGQKEVFWDNVVKNCIVPSYRTLGDIPSPEALAGEID
jgi:hypothetical protein